MNCHNGHKQDLQSRNPGIRHGVVQQISLNPEAYIKHLSTISARNNHLKKKKKPEEVWQGTVKTVSPIVHDEKSLTHLTFRLKKVIFFSPLVDMNQSSLQKLMKIVLLGSLCNQERNNPNGVLESFSPTALKEMNPALSGH